MEYLRGEKLWNNFILNIGDRFEEVLGWNLEDDEVSEEDWGDWWYLLTIYSVHTISSSVLFTDIRADTFLTDK